MGDNIGNVFNKYIDREDDKKLYQLSQLSNKMLNSESSNGIRRRKRNKENPFGVDTNILNGQNEYREPMIGQEDDRNIHLGDSDDERGKVDSTSESDSDNE